MNASTNRQKRRVYSKNNDCMYRIFKNYRGDAIVVIRHDSEQNPSAASLKVCAHDNGKVYEVEGREVDAFETTGKYKWTLKEVVAFVEEKIENRGDYL